MLGKKLKSILEESAEKSDSGPSTELLQEVWETLVGRELAGVTRPESYEDGTLAITASSEEWKKELDHRNRTLQRRIDGYLPWPVDKLEVTVGDLPRAKKPAPTDESTSSHDVSGIEVDVDTEAAIEEVDSELGDSLRRIRQHLLSERDDE